MNNREKADELKFISIEIEEYEKLKSNIERRLDILENEKDKVIWKHKLFNEVSELKKILKKQDGYYQIIDYIVLWYANGVHSHIYTSNETSYSLYLDENNNIYLEDNYFGYRTYPNENLVGFTDIEFTDYYKENNNAD